MPSASKPKTTTTRTKPAPVAKEVAPAPVAGETVVVVDRVEGDVFVSSKDQILRETGNGLQILYSPVPVTNVHPNLYDKATYEDKVHLLFGDLTKIYPL